MKINWLLMAMTATFTLVLSINPLSYAWHENLGIDAKKAAELYQTKPNDPAIVQWKNALQSAINGMDKCAETSTGCDSLMATIISNCNSHPDELLACNDSRIAQYYEAQNKALESEIQDLKKKYYSKAPDAIGSAIIDRCIKNADGSLQYYARSVFCDGELRSLQKDCQTKSNQFNFCQDQRLVGYPIQHNSTVSPYSNLTGNSSSSNSTNP